MRTYGVSTPYRKQSPPSSSPSADRRRNGNRKVVSSTGRRQNSHNRVVSSVLPSSPSRSVWATVLLSYYIAFTITATSPIQQSEAFSSWTTTRTTSTSSSTSRTSKPQATNCYLVSKSCYDSITVKPFLQPRRQTAARTALWMTASSTTASSVAEAETEESSSSSYNDPYVMANQIAPKTNSLPVSLSYYAQYLLRHFFPKQYEKKLQEQKQDKIKETGSSSFGSIQERQQTESPGFWKQFNEQRRNVMTLAGYTKRMIVPSFTFLFLGALMSSIVPNYWGKCIQSVATLSGSRSQLVEALVGLGVSSTLAALFTGVRGSLFWIGGSRANYNVRVKLHRNLLLQEAAFFDINETGYLLSRLNSDVNKIGQVISYHVNVVMRQTAQFIFGSIYLIRISPKLSMYAFAGITLVAWLSAIYGDLARVLAEKVQDTFADATAVAETSFTMSETIRAFDGTEIESGKFEAAQSKALEMEEVQAWAYGSHKFLSDTLQTALQVGLLVACWVAGKAGKLPAGDLTTFLVYTGFVLESSNEVGDQWAKIQQAIGASSSVFDLIKRSPAIRDPPVEELVHPLVSDDSELNPHSGIDSDPLKRIKKPKVIADITESINGLDQVASAEKSEPVIAMKNVTVEYDQMERPALSGINVEVYPGDRVALVGRSGSGKSSMLRTMLRFYDPSSGRIELNGIDLKKLSRAETAALVSLVEQEPHVFPMSLMENVLYSIDHDEIDPETGNPRYSERYRKMVSHCLRLAGLSVEPGNELALDLDTRIGEGGRSLSGGQRQRVAIGRAIIRSPEVLLLDEPTAALDSESERMVVDSLQRAMQHTKSMVMVTHRLGVVRSLEVNRVVVLDRGEIVEEGHPEELLQDETSHYFAIAREQGISKKPSDDIDASNSRQVPAFS
mmetsp:Transcript_13247/g.32328  ORF Transcript_13247/g.32328 Transcript_13247/m.32328 type:complete len:900 (+) Transcript_13247:229-2928(+)